MLEAFLSDEGGAVTVDWVVLTGGLVGLGLATLAVVSGGVESLSGGIGSALSNQEISSRFATLASLLSTGFSGESLGLLGWSIGKPCRVRRGVAVGSGYAGHNVGVHPQRCDVRHDHL